MAYKIVSVHWNNESHLKAVKLCIAGYMQDPMGDSPGHTLLQEEMLVNGLKYHPKGVYFLAFVEENPAGCIISFENFSTFLARPFFNIHDVIVLPVYRGTGIGRALMKRVIKEAELRDCGKITLEVREDNLVAQKLYESEGFGECEPGMKFWVKVL